MAVCKFFLQGNCKFGDRCKFDHPGAQTQHRGNQQNQNRYAPLNNANNVPQGGRGPQRGPRQDFKYNLDPDIVHVDLTSDRPIWPFSVYAPGRTAPRHLIEGPIMEQSPEEMRLRYYAATRLGNPQEAAHEETQLLGEMNQQIQNILGDLSGACRYVQDGENVHPNRLDNTGGAPGQQQQQQTGTFARGNTAAGQPSAFGAAKPAFGQPSAFGGQQQSAFGGASGQQQSAFGAPSGQQQSAFGAPSGQQQSAFGAPSQPQGAFGRPSAFGASANQPSAFGAPSALGGGAANPAFGKPAFGAPSAFGQAANAGSTAGAAPAFGQPSQPSAFGQPGGGAFGAKPGFGQQPAGGSAFGQPSQPGGTGAFGKPAGSPGFGQSGFAQAAQQTGNSGFAQLGQQQQQPGGFGQAANQQAGAGAFGQQQPAANAFGQPAAKPAPFGAPAQQAAPSAFGTPAQQSAPSAFGAPTQQAAPSAFGQSSMNGLSAPQASGFGQQRQPQSNPTPGVAAGADVSTYTTRGTNNQLLSWKGQPVQYMNGNPCYRRPDNGKWERIWLPDGAPPENPYCYAKPEVYGEVLKEAYEYLNRTGTFKDGVMPEEPPMHTAVRWDV